ncbi:gibberellin-regulated protein 6 [Spinacia oleracea]|uniref:Gibberellin-regulated protein 6 n=1 Tax=Spinacia oleracea TaxID=3562 RepID=A0A9R0K6S7_SPIOL|nr:gibberellin-regulated protein 6-like [Spinacia oleracea]
MANIKAFSLLLAFLVVSMLIADVYAGVNYYGNNSLKPYQCQGRCTQRCSKARKTHECMFFCLKCCATCLCVPPGTYGNKEVCPCYNNWKTKRGTSKCP